MKRRTYALIALFLFVIEVIIATRLRHLTFIRNSIGDVLVVVLLYYSALSIRELPRVALAAAVFVFACGVEVCQYFHLAQALGLTPGGVLWTVLGSAFSWGDVICYFVGSLLAVATDKSFSLV